MDDSLLVLVNEDIFYFCEKHASFVRFTLDPEGSIRYWSYWKDSTTNLDYLWVRTSSELKRYLITMESATLDISRVIPYDGKYGNNMCVADDNGDVYCGYCLDDQGWYVLKYTNGSTGSYDASLFVSVDDLNLCDNFNESACVNWDPLQRRVYLSVNGSINYGVYSTYGYYTYSYSYYEDKLPGYRPLLIWIDEDLTTWERCGSIRSFNKIEYVWGYTYYDNNYLSPSCSGTFIYNELLDTQIEDLHEGTVYHKFRKQIVSCLNSGTRSFLIFSGDMGEDRQSDPCHCLDYSRGLGFGAVCIAVAESGRIHIWRKGGKERYVYNPDLSFYRKQSFGIAHNICALNPVSEYFYRQLDGTNIVEVYSEDGTQLSFSYSIGSDQLVIARLMGVIPGDNDTSFVEIQRPELVYIRSTMVSYDRTPTIIFKVGMAPIGVTQQFVIQGHTDKLILDQLGYSDSAPAKWASYSSHPNYADLNWEYSTDFTETLGPDQATWNDLGTSTPISLGGAEPVNGVICNGPAHRYVRFTVPSNLSYGRWFWKIYSITT